MYIIGLLKRTLGPEVVAWDPVEIRRTKSGAEKACTTDRHFYIRFEGGKFLPPVYPLAKDRE